MRNYMCISENSLFFLLFNGNSDEAKNHSTFSTMVTMLIINEIIYIINILHHTTIFYKMTKNSVFSTRSYNFYILIAKFRFQNADNVKCRKTCACRKCRMY